MVMWYRIKYMYYNTKWFFKNIWRHRVALYSEIRPWDMHGGMYLLKEHIRDIRDDMVNTNYGMKEVDETRIPKEVEMTRIIELIENQLEENYIKRCGYDYDYEMVTEENDDGTHTLVSMGTPEQEKNNEIALKEGRELEEKEHKEILEILANHRGWWT